MDEEARNAFFPLIQKFSEGRFRLNEFDREDMVIVGTPDECFEKLLKYEEAGVDQVLCYLNFGYLPHEAVLRSIELLGTEVIPRLKKHRANRVAEGLIDPDRALQEPVGGSGGMIDDMVVIDSIVHAFNSTTANAITRYGKAIFLSAQQFQYSFTAPQYRIPPRRYFQRISADVVEAALFAESQVDIAVFHTVPIWGFIADFSPAEVGLELRRRQPERVYLYGGISPLQGAAGARRSRPSGRGMGHHRPQALSNGHHRRRGEGAHLRRSGCDLSGAGALPEARAEDDRDSQGLPARAGADGSVPRWRHRLCRARFSRSQFRGGPFGHGFPRGKSAAQVARFDNVFVNFETTASLAGAPSAALPDRARHLPRRRGRQAAVLVERAEQFASAPSARGLRRRWRCRRT